MRWFRKSATPTPKATMDSRYAGKPLLILLEGYILDCIGHLPRERDAALTQVVQQVYGGGSDWKATLRSVLHLEDTLDNHLREMWANNQGIAHTFGTKLTPEDFARQVVDENFAQLIDEQS